MSALIDRLPPIRRDVFFFDGDLDAFKRCLAATGVEIRGHVVVPERAPSGWIDAIDGLLVWVIEGKVWIGSQRDIRDARAGRLPFKTIGGRAAT